MVYFAALAHSEKYKWCRGGGIEGRCSKSRPGYTQSVFGGKHRI